MAVTFDDLDEYYKTIIKEIRKFETLLDWAREDLAIGSPMADGGIIENYRAYLDDLYEMLPEEYRALV